MSVFSCVKTHERLLCCVFCVDTVKAIKYNHNINHYKNKEVNDMATTVMQVRVDEELKERAAAICDNLGIDLPTAIRIFLKRTVLLNGIPFSMTLPRQAYKADRALRAMYSLGEESKRNGTADMSLEEINAEIAAARKERDENGI